MSDFSTPSPAGYRFDQFEIRLATRELHGDGAVIDIQPKVFDLLVYLIEHRDRAVDKQELQDAIWPRQVVTEAALTRCLMKARKALGDDAEQQRYIRTVHGMGYHLTAEVEVLGASEGGKVPASTAGESQISNLPRKHPALWLSITPILILISFALIWLWQREAPDPTEFADNSKVVILPVLNATAEARYDWVRLGLMSTLGQVLESGSTTTVTRSRQAVEIAKELGADDPDDETLRALASKLAESDSIGLVVVPVLEKIPGNLRIRYRIARANGRIDERSVVGNSVTRVAQAAGADLRVFLGQRLDETAVTDQFGDEAYIKGRALSMQGEIQAASEMFKIASEHQPGAFWPRYEYALTLRDLGQKEQAERSLRELVAEAEAGTDPSAHSASVNALAILLWRRGKLDEASALLKIGLEVVARENDLATEAIINGNLCILERLRGNISLAREHGLRAIEVYEEQGVSRIPGYVYHSLAQVALAENDFANAESNLRLGIESFRATGKRGNTATGLNSLASLQRLRGLYEDAHRFASESLELRRQLKDRVGEASSRRELGRIEFELGRMTAARKQAESGLAIANELDLDRESAELRHLLAEIDLYQGEFTRAGAALDSVLEAYRERADEKSSFLVSLLQIQLMQHQSRLADAEQLAAELVTSSAEGSEHRAQAHAATARLASAQDQHQRALSEFESATASAPETASPRDLAKFRLGAAKAHFALQQMQSAATELQSAEALNQEFEWLRLAASLALSEGNRAAAGELGQQAREAANERWSDEDQRWLGSLSEGI